MAARKSIAMNRSHRRLSTEVARQTADRGAAGLGYCQRMPRLLSLPLWLAVTALCACPPPDAPESGAPDCLEPVNGTFDAAGGSQVAALTPDGVLTYGLSVPTPTGLQLTLVYDNPGHEGSGTVSVIEACDDQQVLGSVGGELNSLALAVSAGEYLIQVQSEDITLQEGFTLELSTTDVVDHAFCFASLELELPAAVELVAQTGGDAACTNGGGLSGFWFQAPIPPGQAIRVLGDAPVALAGVDDCSGDTSTCAALTGQVGLSNRTADTVSQRFVVVSAVSQTVMIEAVDQADNVDCGSASVVDLTDDAATVEDDLAFGGGDLSCTGELQTLAVPLYYRATVPAGRSLQASVGDSADAAVAILDGCDDNCVVETPDSASFTNLAGEPAEVIVVVGATGPGAGAFSLSLSLDG